MGVENKLFRLLGDPMGDFHFSETENRLFAAGVNALLARYVEILFDEGILSLAGLTELLKLGLIKDGNTNGNIWLGSFVEQVGKKRAGLMIKSRAEKAQFVANATDMIKNDEVFDVLKAVEGVETLELPEETSLLLQQEVSRKKGKYVQIAQELVNHANGPIRRTELIRRLGGVYALQSLHTELRRHDCGLVTCQDIDFAWVYPLAIMSEKEVMKRFKLPPDRTGLRVPIEKERDPVVLEMKELCGVEVYKRGDKVLARPIIVPDQLRLLMAMYKAAGIHTWCDGRRLGEYILSTNPYSQMRGLVDRIRELHKDKYTPLEVLMKKGRKGKGGSSKYMLVMH